MSVHETSRRQVSLYGDESTTANYLYRSEDPVWERRSYCRVVK